MAYSKLHSSIVNSSLWTESDTVRILFITLLATCDRDGIVYGTRFGLSRLANIAVEEAENAWDSLLSTDPESSDLERAPENEGRRIEKIPGGFKLLNFAYYRGLRNDDDRREQNRAAQARFKAKVSHDQSRSATGKTESASRARSEAEAEAEASVPPKEHTTRSAPSGFAVPPCFEKVDGFAAALAGWIEHRKMIRKPPTGRAIQLLINRLAEHPDRAVKALDTIVEQCWQSFRWDYLDNTNAKRPNPNQRSDSTRNIGHNANLDYSKRTTKESPAGAYPGLKETLDAVFRGVPPEGQPKPPESAG